MQQEKPVQDVLSLILGGGRGKRLYPLTKRRSEPAVPIAGKYRLIDIPVSNCLNSNLKRIYVLTQFLSASLHRHIGTRYAVESMRVHGHYRPKPAASMLSRGNRPGSWT